MTSRFVLGVAILSLGTSVAYAGAKETATEPNPATVEMNVDNIVDGRRAGFWMSAGLFGGMFGVVQRGGDVKGLAFSARTLAGWADAMPGLFSEGAVNEKSNALPAVWSDRAGFNAIAAEYQQKTKKLAELAKAGDNEAFKTQWADVRQTCNSCHETYRKETPRK